MRMMRLGIFGLLTVAALWGAGLNSRIADAAEAGDRAAVRALIDEKADGVAIDEVAIRNGMTTMLDDGLAKCRAGATSARSARSTRETASPNTGWSTRSAGHRCAVAP